MNKVEITYWIVVLVKAGFLAYIILPIIVWGVVLIWSLIVGYQPTDHVKDLTHLCLGFLLGYHFYSWVLGHKQAVEDYYDSKD